MRISLTLALGGLLQMTLSTAQAQDVFGRHGVFAREA